MNKKIAINKVYHLDMNEHQFIENNALEYAPYIADINKELEKKYEKLLDGDEGIEINILSELPRRSVIVIWISACLVTRCSDTKRIRSYRSQKNHRYQNAKHQ